MATLYELAEELENFELEIDEETGEVLNLADLDKVEMEFKKKVEGICLWIKNLKADASAWMEHTLLRIRTFIRADTERRRLRMGRIAFLKRKVHAAAWTNRKYNLIVTT